MTPDNCYLMPAYVPLVASLPVMMVGLNCWPPHPAPPVVTRVPPKRGFAPIFADHAKAPR